MLNKEKYKNRLEEILAKTITVSKSGEIYRCTDRGNCKDCIFCSAACVDDARKWLNSEYKESILTEEEREYLSSVIKPFRKKVEYIAIWGAWNGSKQFVHIELSDMDYANLPNFETNTMYKWMKPRKHYSLEELGL